MDNSAGTEVNVLSVLKQLQFGNPIFDGDEKLKRKTENKLREFRTSINRLEENYGIFEMQIKTKSKHTLFVDNTETIIHTHGSDEKMYLVKLSDISIIIPEDEKDAYSEYPIYEFDNIVKEIVHQFYELLEILGLSAELLIQQKEKEDNPLLGPKNDIIEKVINDFVNEEFDNKTSHNLSMITLSHHGIFNNKDSDKNVDDKIKEMDFYKKPGVVIDIESGLTGGNVKIKAVELNETPEGILANIVRLHKVIGMSATVNNKSVFYNYDLSYRGIKDKIWKMPKSLYIEYKKYLNSRFDLFKNVEMDINFVPPKNGTKEIQDYVYNFMNNCANQTACKKYQKRIKEFINDNEGDQYYLYAQLKVVYAILQAYSNNCYKGLCVLPFGKNNFNYASLWDVLGDMEKIINKYLERQLYLFETLKEDLDENNTAANKILMVPDGHNSTCLMIGPYGTLGKAGNFQFKTNNLEIIKDFVPINTYGKNQLNEFYNSDRVNELELNLDFIYIAEKTHLLDYSAKNETEKLLGAYYLIGALNEAHQINEDEYDKLMKLANKPFNNKYETSVFYRNETRAMMKRKITYSASAMQFFEQAIGRLPRAPYMRKKVICLIDEDLAKNVQDSVSDKYKLYEEDDWDSKSEMTKMLIEAVFNHEGKYKSQNIQTACTKAANIVDCILREINGKFANRYIEVYKEIKGIRKLAVTKDERAHLPLIQSELYYVVNKDEILESGGYSYNVDSKIGNNIHIANNLYKVGAASIPVSRDVFGIDNLPKDVQDYLEKDGFNFEINKEKNYLLLPPGVFILYGELGESIVIYIVNEKLQELPPEIYEKADFIYERNDGSIAAIDAKYYKVHEVDYDGVGEKKDWFEKAYKIQKHFNGKKVDYIVLNTRNNNDETKRHDVKRDDLYPNINLITFPNIYTKDNLGNDIVDAKLQVIINNVIKRGI